MTVGRPRPDMLSRCLPPATAHDAPIFGLSNFAETCQAGAAANLARINDGFKSFPSGHSSCAWGARMRYRDARADGYAGVGVVSFAGLGFLSFYLAGKLHLADTGGHRVSDGDSPPCGVTLADRGLACSDPRLARALTASGLGPGRRLADG